MGFTGGSDNRSKVDSSEVNLTITNGGLALFGRGKNSKVVAGDSISIGRGASYNVVNTVSGTNGADTSKIAGDLFGGGGGGGGLGAATSSGGSLKWIAIGGAALVLVIVFFLRKR